MKHSGSRQSGNARQEDAPEKGKESPSAPVDKADDDSIWVRDSSDGQPPVIVPEEDLPHMSLPSVGMSFPEDFPDGR